MTVKTRNATSSVQRRWNVRGNNNEMTMRRTTEIRDSPNERQDGRTTPQLLDPIVIGRGRQWWQAHCGRGIIDGGGHHTWSWGREDKEEEEETRGQAGVAWVDEEGNDDGKGYGDRGSMAQAPSVVIID